MENNDLLMALESLKKELVNIKSASEQVEQVLNAQNKITQGSEQQLDSIKKAVESVIALANELNSVGLLVKNEYLPALDHITETHLLGADSQIRQASSNLDKALRNFDNGLKELGKELKEQYLKDLSNLVDAYMQKSIKAYLQATKQYEEASKGLISLQENLDRTLKESIIQLSTVYKTDHQHTLKKIHEIQENLVTCQDNEKIILRRCDYLDVEFKKLTNNINEAQKESTMKSNAAMYRDIALMIMVALSLLMSFI